VIPIVIATFATVFSAELVGDKNLLMVLSLGTRFRRLLVLAGILPAVVAKMGVAVLFGKLLLQVPRSVTGAVTGLTFMIAALLLVWDEREKYDSWTGAKKATSPSALAFTTVFLSEWCDPGQLAAAALTAKYGAPITVWLAATGAVFTKFSLALLVGNHLTRIVPQVVIRYSMACALLAAGAVSLFRAVV